MAARQQVRDAIEAGGYGQRELILRVNGLNTAWGYDDLRRRRDGGRRCRAAAEDATAPNRCGFRSAILEAAGAPPELAVWCMMETPRAVLHAEEIAGAHPRLAGFVMGTSDLANDLRARHTRDRLPLLTSLGLCLLAARAAGLAILDGVHLDLADDEGFAQPAGRAPSSASTARP